MTHDKDTCSVTAFFTRQALEKDGDLHWRMARDRVLHYLDALGMPVVRSVDLTARVLKEGREQTVGDGQAVAAAMRILHRILDEEKICRIPEVDLTGQAGLNIESVPVLNRGKMIPEEFDS